MADSRLLVGARPAAVRFSRLNRIILPVVIRDQERSITVAQFQRRIGQRVRHSRRAVRLGPMPRTTTLSLPL